MRSDILARLKLPPRRFRRLVIAGLLLPTWWFSWGVRTEGCSSDRPVALLAPVRSTPFADPELWWLVPAALLFLALPFLVERVERPGLRALVNVFGALLGAFVSVTLLFIAAFAQTLFGRLLSLSAAGVVGIACSLGLTLEALSWVATDIATAWRARRGGERTSGVQPVAGADGELAADEPSRDEPPSGELVVDEQGGEPAGGGALKDEG
jgi:hypothetical protein